MHHIKTTAPAGFLEQLQQQEKAIYEHGCVVENAGAAPKARIAAYQAMAASVQGAISAAKTLHHRLDVGLADHSLSPSQAKQLFQAMAGLAAWVGANASNTAVPAAVAALPGLDAAERSSLASSRGQMERAQTVTEHQAATYRKAARQL